MPRGGAGSKRILGMAQPSLRWPPLSPPPRPLRSRQAQSIPKALRRPATRPMPLGLDIADGPRIEAGPVGHLLLGQPQSEPGGPDPPRQAVTFRNEPGSEDRLDGWPAPSQGLALVPLQGRDRLRVAAQPLGKGSLRKPQVHPRPADPLTERPGLARITAWEYSRLWSSQPQAGKWQRNGVAVDGSGIRDAAAAARRLI